MSGGIAFDQTTQALMDLQGQIDALSEQLRSFRLMFWRHLQEHHKESLLEYPYKPPEDPIRDYIRRIAHNEAKRMAEEIDQQMMGDSVTRTWEIEGS